MEPRAGVANVARRFEDAFALALANLGQVSPCCHAYRRLAAFPSGRPRHSVQGLDLGQESSPGAQ